jgi:hypothetical protein
MNMVQTIHYGAPESPNPLGGQRPDERHLPISAAAWDAAATSGADARFVIPILFEAIKRLEVELMASRTE